MKQIFLLLITLYFPRMVPAQVDNSYKGIKWTEGLTWEQIKGKAQQENKYILVDCYATWCKPCKLMDKNIYPNEEVGQFVNEHFIAVKVQQDRTSNDNQLVRQWYPAADTLFKRYQIKALPTFLFFSSDGTLVHREYGSKMFPAQFLELVKSALNPTKQYYSLLIKYQTGERDPHFLMQLARSSILADQMDFAQQVANEYVGKLDIKTNLSKETFVFMKEFRQNDLVRQFAINYKKSHLDKLKDSALFTKENIEFVSIFPELLNSRDRFFTYFFKNACHVDSLTDSPGFADFYVKAIIVREEIINKLWKDKKPITRTPKWRPIIQAIENKYGAKYADELVSNNKLSFYKNIGDWKSFTRVFEARMKKFPPQRNGNKFGTTWGDAVELNEAAWNVFQLCNDKAVLKRALFWSSLSIELEQPNPNPTLLDTKANLLYKLGFIEEAISLEQKAIELDKLNAVKRGQKVGDQYEQFTSILTMMRKGVPTWKNSEKED